jgi:hypothetical protein
MFARKFIDHVETHADQLCKEFMRKIERSDKCGELLRKVPLEEQWQSTREIYRDLTDWLLNKPESVAEDRYVDLGVRRTRQGVPLSELFWVVRAAREYFWEYMERETLLDEPVDFWGGVELLHSLDQFFDRAIYFVIIGHQRASSDEREHAAVLSITR